MPWMDLWGLDVMGRKGSGLRGGTWGFWIDRTDAQYLES
jgi:hypothetical protein